ncbi:MAG: FUSC family membrane protein, partial [Chitinophagales bacterium]
MDYTKEYRSFISSHYVSESIRITVGLSLPAILFNYLNNLPVGIAISLGASCVIMVDSAGPIHHRRNAMIICDLLIFLVALLTGLLGHSNILLGICIFFLCFSLSMIAVFGSRVSSIGLAGLFIMVLQIGRIHYGKEIFINALLVFAGGLWYTLLSLLLFSIRPYKLVQQALGECIQSTAAFLRIKSSFYGKDFDDEKNYRLLLDQQVIVHQQQDLVRELLFKSRDIVKESTHIGRILVAIFVDMVDLYEQIMSAPQDYPAMRQFAGDSGILEKFKLAISKIAEDLDELGLDMKTGKRIENNDSLPEYLSELRADFDSFRDNHRTADNVEGFYGLRNILNNIEEIGERLMMIRGYGDKETSHRSSSPRKASFDQFVSHERPDLKLLRDNLSLHSNIFRHALRVSFATLIGYIISLFLPLGHSYWILLTIIVILKPTYGITKKRNYDRLLGTIGGAAIGLVLLYLVKDKNIVFAFLILFMIVAYSFMRTRYLVFVLFMTPYILLLFYFLDPADFRITLEDRVVDTVIGSVVAFLSNLLLVPAWEQEQFGDYLVGALQSNLNYFEEVGKPFQGFAFSIDRYKLARKENFVAMSNLTEAYNRVLSEPRRKQSNLPAVYN